MKQLLFPTKQTALIGVCNTTCNTKSDCHTQHLAHISTQSKRPKPEHSSTTRWLRVWETRARAGMARSSFDDVPLLLPAKHHLDTEKKGGEHETAPPSDREWQLHFKGPIIKNKALFLWGQSSVFVGVYLYVRACIGNGVYVHSFFIQMLQPEVSTLLTKKHQYISCSRLFCSFDCQSRTENLWISVSF